MNGVLLRYRLQPKDAFRFLADRGTRDVDLALSNTDDDLDELLALANEFRALLDDVFAEDRTDRLIELHARFVDWRTAQEIAEAEYPTNTDKESS